MESANHADVELDALVSIFYDDPGSVGVFEQVHAEQLPEVERQLLAHNAHMTVTVERHHGCPVTVNVIETDGADSKYSRKIELKRECDGKVVQFGIVRLNLTALDQAVREEIESEQIPLGRVLIEHNVLREVKLQNLYRVSAGAVLADSFGIPEGSRVFGRTAMIWCNGSPAIELLEIVGNC